LTLTTPTQSGHCCYDKFLDYAAQDLLILRKVDGGYRFTHDYLRQHLAASAWERSQG